jgi:transcriptional regulator with XRE-family HTH domain
VDPIGVENAVAEPLGQGYPAAGPTVLRLVVGARLRRLREAAAMTAADAGSAIRGSHSKISRLEGGKTRFKLRDVDDLLTYYGIGDDAERAEIRAMAELANRPAWWSAYGDVIPAWFEAYLGFEQAAGLVRGYEPQFIPGLLQTADYAAAVLRLGRDSAGRDTAGRDTAGRDSAAPTDLDRLVDLRMRRQQVLYRTEPVKLWVVIDEAVLRRPVGGRDTMRTQLRHLVSVAALPHVTVQLLPFRAGGHVAAGGPVSIVRFREIQIPDIVYLEHLATADYYDKPASVAPYLDVMNRLSVQAERPDTTLELLDQIRY